MPADASAVQIRNLLLGSIPRQRRCFSSGYPRLRQLPKPVERLASATDRTRLSPLLLLPFRRDAPERDHHTTNKRQGHQGDIRVL